MSKSFYKRLVYTCITEVMYSVYEAILLNRFFCCFFLEVGDCFEGDGSNYQGQASTTVSGRTCLVWSGVYDFLPSNNYCRNYFSAYGVTEPVCYYQPGSYYVEPCGVPKCGIIDRYTHYDFNFVFKK